MAIKKETLHLTKEEAQGNEPIKRIVEYANKLGLDRTRVTEVTLVGTFGVGVDVHFYTEPAAPFTIQHSPPYSGGQ